MENVTMIVLLIVLGKPIQPLLEIFSDPAPLTRNFVWIGQISTNLMDKCEDPLQPSRFVGFRIVWVTAEVDTGHPLLFEGVVSQEAVDQDRVVLISRFVTLGMQRLSGRYSPVLLRLCKSVIYTVHRLQISTVVWLSLRFLW